MAATPCLQEALRSPSCSCHRHDCPLHRVTRSGLEGGAHLDLTPCESMKSRAKKLFHDCVEHTPNRTHTREGKAHSATVATLILTQCHTCTKVTQQAEQTRPRHTSGRDVLLPAWRRSSFGSTSKQEGTTCADRKPDLASTYVVQESRDKCPRTLVRRRHPLQARAQGKRNTCSYQIPLVLKPQRNHTHTLLEGVPKADRPNKILAKRSSFRCAV